MRLQYERFVNENWNPTPRDATKYLLQRSIGLIMPTGSQAGRQQPAIGKVVDSGPPSARPSI